MALGVKNYLIISALLILIYGCEKDQIVKDGMKPVYYSYDDFSELRSGSSLPYDHLGKIVTKGQHIFINEQGKGIHVIDNTNSLSPKQLFFWHIMGNTEFTLNGDVLYANNGKHLLIIDISDFSKIKVIKIIKNQYNPELLELYPQGYKGFFECYNGSLGILKAWEKAEIKNPYCRTN